MSEVFDAVQARVIQLDFIILLVIILICITLAFSLLILEMNVSAINARLLFFSCIFCYFYESRQTPSALAKSCS